MFKIKSDWPPAGDQMQAIEQLSSGINDGEQNQVLFGVTGSGKTFTMANVINNVDRPAMIMAPNKTLAAQLYEEMRSFFPENAVEYFVSYYDYYQPEAYIPQRDMFIEKDAVINEHISRLRHSATRSMFERSDVIVVCSVSCIYGLGNPESYASMKLTIRKGDTIKADNLSIEMAALQYERGEYSWSRGKFRIMGDTVDIFPAHSNTIAWRIKFDIDTVAQIIEIEAISCKAIRELEVITLYANTHYITARPTIDNAIKHIKEDLKDRLNYFYDHGKVVEATRLDQRVKYDIEMLLETGHCKGIEHYSRYMNNSNPGEPPPTLFGYMPKNSILFMDESHISVPQISGMYNGDKARKTSLIEYGFRLPSALDNRPLKFEEWDALRPNTIFVSATPSKFELSLTQGKYAEQVIRPTGLVDPIVTIRPAINQISDITQSAKETIKSGERVLITSLTKKTAEHVTEYLNDNGCKSEYLHSGVKTIDRIETIMRLRKGEIDVIVGVNLLREGLDIPECSLVGILDGDKEGFLRSEVSLLQTIGRAARNSNGKVIIYADKMTKSIDAALLETQKRRIKQLEYNKTHGITPRTIQKTILNNLENKILSHMREEIDDEIANSKLDVKTTIKNLEKEMKQHADELDFEMATKIKAKISQIKKLYINS